MTVQRNYVLLFVINAVITYLFAQDGMAKYIVVLALAFYFLCDTGLQLRVDPFRDQNTIGIITPVIFITVVGTALAVIRLNLSMYSFRYICFYTIPVVAAVAYDFYLKRMNYSPEFAIEQLFWLNIIFFLIKGVTRFSLENLMEDATKAYVFGAFFIFFSMKKVRIRDIGCIHYFHYC